MKAHWIFIDDQPVYEKRSIFFRKEFALSKLMSDQVIHVSAESRYRLWINGTLLMTGSLKGDSERKYYESIDISPFLQIGMNVITAQVLHFPPNPHKATQFLTGPASIITKPQGGFFLEGTVEIPSTDISWKVFDDTSYGFTYAEQSKYVGNMEEIDSRKIPRGWLETHFDDSAWNNAVFIATAKSADQFGLLNQWQLIPRDIPLLSREQFSATTARTVEGSIDFLPLLQGETIHIPPRTTAVFDVDAGALSTCYVETALDQGENSKVTFLYSECYAYRDEETSVVYKKNRNDFVNGNLYGEQDVFYKGEEAQTYEPFFFRTFRFLRVSIVTQDQPLTIKSLRFYMTGYPFGDESKFYSPDSTTQSMWEISERTIHRCAHETYEDCPYYEQAQYLMDSAIQQAIGYYLTSDDALVKKSFYDFRASQTLDGMMSCNSPATFKQIIPGFSIYFIDMVARHYKYYGNKEVLIEHLPSMFEILSFFASNLSSDTRLVVPSPYWEFVDWVDAWDETNGSPLQEGDSYNYINSFLYAYGLLTLADLCNSLGFYDLETELLRQHGYIKGALNEHSFDLKAGLYRSTDTSVEFSQHAQLWAVLAEVADEKSVGVLMERCISDTDLLQCSYAMAFYLFRAVEKSGVYNKSAHLWDKWTQLLPLEITTWPEDPVRQRSECHAWSSVSIFEVCRNSFGISPATPGYETIRIAPKEFSTTELSASIPTVRGVIVATRRATIQNGMEGLEYTYQLSNANNVDIILPTQSYTQYTDNISFFIPIIS